ncbi:MAG: biotin--[acetyl-CoA-carboxylase] ligase [Flammeovirgaceae bacterium]|jgi:BirA family biotin operon repressor/biotin-[acetyl-CoA-carboxylase] ligase|nr:biotin--[acetyl-CoA-carboxylase] ligase [Flammeovirgaceae bacterium]
MVYETVNDTLFTAKQIIYLPECPSTNDFLLAELNRQTSVEGLVVITNKQTAGKGQRGNTWITEPGKNLTFSILFKPVFVLPKHQFFMSMACSLAVADWLKSLNINDVKVKWPNDVYVGKKKIAGILIENQLRGTIIQHSVWGIGININQTDFGDFPATSVYQIIGVEQDVRSCFQSLILCIEKRYLQLKAGLNKHIKQDYLSSLLAYQTMQQFEDADGLFMGKIEDVLDSGHVCIQQSGSIKQYDLKEVKMILD